MPSTFSANKGYQLQATGSDIGTWGANLNTVLSTVDLNFGGRFNVDVSGNSDVTVSDSAAENFRHVVSGALTGNINYILPSVGSFYLISNNTTGAFSLTVEISGGAGLSLPQGQSAFLFTNPDSSTVDVITVAGSLTDANLIRYIATFMGANPLTQQQVNDQVVSLLPFMSATQLNDFLADAGAVDQSSAISALESYISTYNNANFTRAVGVIPAGSYLITTGIQMQNNVYLEMRGAKFLGPITGFGVINSGNSPSIPASSDAATQQAGGCFFNLTALGTAEHHVSGPHTFSGFRYNVVFGGFNAINCSWKGMICGAGNCGILVYGFIQFCDFGEFESIGVNNTLIAGATCFTADNTYVVAAPFMGWSSYIGGCSLGCGLDNQFNTANATWDAWVAGALLRATSVDIDVGTWAAAAQASEAMTHASGRPFYIPGRGGQVAGSVKIHDIIVNNGPRGALVLGNTLSAEIDNVSGSDGEFSDSTINAGPPYTESMITMWNNASTLITNVVGNGVTSGIGPLATINVISQGSNSIRGENIQGPGAVNGVRTNVFQPWQSTDQVDLAGLSGNQQFNMRRGTGSFASIPPSAGTASTIFNYAFQGYLNWRKDEGSGAQTYEATADFSLPLNGVETEAIITLAPAIIAVFGSVVGTLEIWLTNLANANWKSGVTDITDYAKYTVCFGTEPFNLGGYQLGADVAMGANSYTINKALNGLLGPGSFTVFDDGTHKEVAITKNVSGTTVNIEGTFLQAYAAATPTTIKQPFTVMANPVPFAHGSPWIAPPFDSNGGMVIASTVANRLMIRLKFSEFGPPT